MDRYHTAWQFQLDKTENFAFWQGAFSEEECEKIIQIGNKNVLNDAAVFNPQKNSVRTSKVSWLYPNDEMEWVFKRVTDIVVNLNDRFFGFDLFGAAEGFQFTKYEAPSGKYGKHIDRAPNTLVRKLSFTLQLSDPKDYEGGELRLHLEDKPEKISKQRGYVCLFPSYVLHEVTPVTKGTRYSLVSWITGKPFK